MHVWMNPVRCLSLWELGILFNFFVYSLCLLLFYVWWSALYFRYILCCISRTLIVPYFSMLALQMYSCVEKSCIRFKRSRLMEIQFHLWRWTTEFFHLTALSRQLIPLLLIKFSIYYSDVCIWCWIYIYSSEWLKFKLFTKSCVLQRTN